MNLDTRCSNFEILSSKSVLMHYLGVGITVLCLLSSFPNPSSFVSYHCPPITSHYISTLIAPPSPSANSTISPVASPSATPGQPHPHRGWSADTLPLPFAVDSGRDNRFLFPVAAYARSPCSTRLPCPSVLKNDHQALCHFTLSDCPATF